MTRNLLLAAVPALLTLAAAAPMTAGAAGAPGSALFCVRDYGAVGDGRHRETAALNRAVAACAAAGGGTVAVPPGRYLTGTVTLKSHVTLLLDPGATLVASTDPADYPDTPDIWTDGGKVIGPVVYAEDAENVTITGRGEIDGQGAVWWRRLDLAQPRKGMAGARTPEEKADAERLSRGRPQMIRLLRCRDVIVEHVRLKDSPEWNVHPLLCEGVRVDGVTITAPPDSHNTDGINPESCRGVQIMNCRIDNGDDCVTLKSGRDAAGRRVGQPDEDITITNCVMLHGHGGVTIGSEMSGGVRNVVVSNCVFQGTDNGIRIKSQRGRGGVVEGLTVSNIAMQDVPHPFTITTFYMGRDKPGDVFPVDEGTPRFRGFLFSGITARGAKDAGSVTGLREMPVEDITFSNVHITAALGFTCTNARDVAFKDTVIDTATGPALVLRDASGIDTARLTTRAPHDGTPLVDTSAAVVAKR